MMMHKNSLSKPLSRAVNRTMPSAAVLNVDPSTPQAAMSDGCSLNVSCAEMQELVADNRACNLFPLYAELNADMETPVSAFLKVRRGKHSFLLESVEGGEQIARYSFIGTEPFKYIEQSTKNINLNQTQF